MFHQKFKNLSQQKILLKEFLKSHRLGENYLQTLPGTCIFKSQQLKEQLGKSQRCEGIFYRREHRTPNQHVKRH